MRTSEFYVVSTKTNMAKMQLISFEILCCYAKMMNDLR